ncbi:MAG: hypothetical protein IPK67_18270 [Planctomycetes bacterium]|nr:hypothetical protein [Planctomycetota bacterium]
MRALALALCLALPQESPARSLEWRLYCAAMRAAGDFLAAARDRPGGALARGGPPQHRGFEHQYIAHLASRSAAVHALHSATITDLAVSPDGKWLATACGDGSARIVEAESGATRHELVFPRPPSGRPSFHPTARGSPWPLRTARPGCTRWRAGASSRFSPGRARRGGALAFGPDDLLAVCSWDRTPERGVWGIVELWDSVKGVRLEHLEHGVKPIAAIDFNADGTLLAAGTWDGDVALWTVGGWGEARRLFAPKNDDYQAVRDLAFAPPGPAGDELAVSYADGRARLYDARTLTLLCTLDTTAPGVVKELNDLCYLPDGARLATVGADLTLRLWERASGKLLSEYAGHTRSVQSVAAHPGGKLLFTGAADGSVRTWDLEALEPARSIWRGPSTSYSLALSPDGSRAATTGWGGFVRIVEVETGRELARWDGHGTSGVGVDWSADGRFLSTTGNDGRIVLWDAETRAELKVLADHEGQVLATAFSPDSRLLAGAGAGGDVCLWSVPDGAPLAALADAPGQVDYLHFRPGPGSPPGTPTASCGCGTSAPTSSRRARGPSARCARPGLPPARERAPERRGPRCGAGTHTRARRSVRSRRRRAACFTCRSPPTAGASRPVSAMATSSCGTRSRVRASCASPTRQESSSRAGRAEATRSSPCPWTRPCACCARAEAVPGPRHRPGSGVFGRGPPPRSRPLGPGRGRLLPASPAPRPAPWSAGTGLRAQGLEPIPRHAIVI